MRFKCRRGAVNGSPAKSNGSTEARASVSLSRTTVRAMSSCHWPFSNAQASAKRDGADITFEWVQGPKGRAATQVLELDASTAAPRPPREGRPRRDFDDGGGGGGGGASGPTEQLDGVVKWYDPARGFGFILPSDGGKDVFVHVTALRRAGIDDLQPGQNV